MNQPRPVLPYHDHHGLRRVLLQAAREPGIVQHKLDAAEFALALGETALAQALFDMACVRMGFGPAERRRMTAVAERTGLGMPPVHADGGSGAAPGGSSIDLAVGELRGLLADPDLAGDPSLDRAAVVDAAVRALEPPTFVPLVGEADRAAGRAPSGPLPARTLRYLPPASTGRSATSAAPDGGWVFACCATLRARLGGAADPVALGTALEELRCAFVDAPPFDLYADVNDLGRTAAACLAHDLRDFLSLRRALWCAPTGSAALLRATARLGGAGLGAYLGNVANLLRTHRDLFGLLHLAGSRPPDGGVLTQWLPVLAIHLPLPMREALAGELGDLGLVEPLWALTAEAMGQSPVRDNIPLLWHLRDAALDIGLIRLAIDAQRFIACREGGNAIEWRVLGDLQASAGELAEAEFSYQAGWSLAAGDAEFAARLQALAAGDRPFLQLVGLGTTPLRQQRRARHRSANAPAMPA